MPRSSAQQVNVKVVDSLATVVAGIDDRSKPRRKSLAASNARRTQVKMPQCLLVLGVRFCQGANVLTRYDQYVRGRLGIDVPERVSPIVFKDLLRRDLTGH